MFITKHVFHQILAMVPVNLQDFMIGAGSGWSSPIIESFKNSGTEFSLTEEDCSWIASLHYVGRAAGCLLSAGVLDKVGRVLLLAVSSALTLCLWIGVLLTKKVLFHYVIRFVFGLSVGLVDTAMPVYVTENSSPNLRGVFLNVICLFFFAGELFAFSLATYTSYETVAAAVAACAALNLTSALLFREPAQYLVMKGCDAAKAKRRFEWMRGGGAQAAHEFDEITAKLAHVETRFFSRRMFVDRRFRIVACVNALAYMTGFPALNALLASALLPTSALSRNELTILYGATQLVGTCVFSAVIERYGRRTLFVGSLAVCAVANAASAALHYCAARGVHVPHVAWLLFASITLYATVFASVLFSLIAVLRAELLPPRFKAAGICASVILNSASGFLTTQIFLLVSNAFGMYTNFLIFTVACVVTLLYVHAQLPETRGLTLMEIQKIFDE